MNQPIDLGETGDFVITPPDIRDGAGAGNRDSTDFFHDLHQVDFGLHREDGQFGQLRVIRAAAAVWAVHDLEWRGLFGKGSR